MKRTIITMMAGLTFISTTIAQSADRVAAKGFAVFSANDTFHPYEFTRHAAGENDIRIEILYAGICHSDLQVAWYEQQEQELYADASKIDKAWRNVVDGKVKFRYVIDMSTIK